MSSRTRSVDPDAEVVATDVSALTRPDDRVAEDVVTGVSAWTRSDDRVVDVVGTVGGAVTFVSGVVVAHSAPPSLLLQP
ncbi:hypothetical protein ABC270_11610 [Curtobacterium sp. 1P10AnD]|uniref:hypothetical protein n=1 Tax=Curtobacterium sp. 1P10AnD TaxID=3132283 RepID=UPI0039A1D69C